MSSASVTILLRALEEVLGRVDEAERTALVQGEAVASATREVDLRVKENKSLNERISDLEEENADIRRMCEAAKKHTVVLENENASLRAALDAARGCGPAMRPSHAMSITTDVLRSRLLSLAADGDGKGIEDVVDAGLRHRNDDRPVDYLAHWLAVGRCFGYVKRDDSWGEFEKIFSIIVKRMLIAESLVSDLKRAKLNQSEQQRHE